MVWWENRVDGPTLSQSEWGCIRDLYSAPSAMSSGEDCKRGYCLPTIWLLERMAETLRVNWLKWQRVKQWLNVNKGKSEPTEAVMNSKFNYGQWKHQVKSNRKVCGVNLRDNVGSTKLFRVNAAWNKWKKGSGVIIISYVTRESRRNWKSKYTKPSSGLWCCMKLKYGR